MTTQDLLLELHRRGAVAYRVGDKVRVRPATAVPPDLARRLREHKAELLLALPDAPQRTMEWLAVQVASRLLDGMEVWIAENERSATELEAEFLRESGAPPIIFTAAEVQVLAGMLEQDRRALLRALVMLKRACPGAVLERVTTPDTETYDG